MEMSMASTTTLLEGDRGRARAHQRNLRRWIIPIGGGFLAAVLIVIGTPHVAWYLRVFLAVIAFLYIGGQSAAYLWSTHSDQG
jgi:hypothetical protein